LEFLVNLEQIVLTIAGSGQILFFSKKTPLNMDMLMKKPFLFPEKTSTSKIHPATSE